MEWVHLGFEGLAVESGSETLSIALALSVMTGRPFAWNGFRRRGSPAGFRSDEEKMVALFAEMSNATSAGGTMGETDLRFEPSDRRAGSYRSELGGVEPVVPWVHAAVVCASFAAGDSEIVLEGSTHAADQATFEILSTTWVHLVNLLGIEVELALEGAGFVPKGGGLIRARVKGGREDFRAIELLEKAPLVGLRILSAGASLPSHVQQRQAARARSGVQIAGVEPSVQLLKLRAKGAGSTVAITGFFGELPLTVGTVSGRGISAEAVGEQAAREFRALLSHRAAVPPGLIISLVAPLTLSEGASAISTSALHPRAPDAVAIASAFTGRRIDIDGKVGKPARLDFRF